MHILIGLLVLFVLTATAWGRALSAVLLVLAVIFGGIFFLLYQEGEKQSAERAYVSAHPAISPAECYRLEIEKEIKEMGKMPSPQAIGGAEIIAKIICNVP